MPPRTAATRAVGARDISPALQRGESHPNSTPESRRDGAKTVNPSPKKYFVTPAESTQQNRKSLQINSNPLPYLNHAPRIRRPIQPPRGRACPNPMAVDRGFRREQGVLTPWKIHPGSKRQAWALPPMYFSTGAVMQRETKCPRQTQIVIPPEASRATCRAAQTARSPLPNIAH